MGTLFFLGTVYNYRHYSQDTSFADIPVSVFIFQIWVDDDVCIDTTLPSQVVCDTMSIFKWSKAGLISVFSFSSTGCQKKDKNQVCPIIYL